MCVMDPDCPGGQAEYWEGEPTHFGGESIKEFGCTECGQCTAL